MAATNGHAAKGLDDTVSKDHLKLLQCLSEIMLIRDELGADIDINKLGVTLFLRKIKA